MSKERILIVEDNSIVVMEIEERLAKLGYEVVGSSSSGERAVEMAGELTPDLVLMDIKLKGEMDGVQAAAYIRKTLDIPVVFLTAHTDESTLLRAKSSEPYGYIVKPFNERELFIALEIALSKHHLERKVIASERWLATILNSIADALLVIDRQGLVTYVNPVAEMLLGVPKTSMLSRPLTETAEIFDVESNAITRPVMQKVLSSGEPARLTDLMLNARAGNETHIDASFTPLRDEKDKVSGLVLIFRDISERVLMEEALRERDERYTLATNGANDGLWDWDLRSQDIYYSPRWKTMLGYEDAEIGSDPEEWFSRVHPRDLEQLKGVISAHLDGLLPHVENEHRLMDNTGNYRWVLCRGLAVRNGDGQAYRMAGSLTDITIRKQNEEKLYHDAFYDLLTELPNRALFIDRLRHQIELTHRRHDYFYAVLFLDLDRFKNINDSLGHVIGDQLLIACARRLQSCLRTTDTIARFGGDEFVILMEDVSGVSEAIVVAERIKRELLLPFNIRGHEMFITASIGIVYNHTDYNEPEEVLRDADIAMYRAKAFGRAHFEVFEQAMRARLLSRVTIETDLRKALDRGEIRPFYQPIVSLRTGKIEGFEALARWQHPERGLLNPAEFIREAEETGLIIALDIHILKEACRQIRAWQLLFPSEPPISISVNLSSQHFLATELVENVREALRDSGLSPSSLKIEITESGLVEHGQRTKDILSALSQLGVRLEIDDFGIGYSSLSYLQYFPISALKIDRAFVSNMVTEAYKSKIVQTIINLAHNMEFDVIAEGAETESEMRELRDLGCEYGQGFYFAGPQDTQEVEAMLRANRLNPTGELNWAGERE